MSTRITTEALFFIMVLVVWLGPAGIATFRRHVSLLHPSFLVPLYLMFSVSNALTEHWFHWSGRGFAPGIRAETRLLQGDEAFYLIPLAIVAGLGVIFHLGVAAGCGRTLATQRDCVHTYLARRLQRGGRRGAHIALGCTAGILICVTPYLLLGQERGFFWCVAMYSIIPFFPFMAAVYARRYVVPIFLLGLGTMLVFPSKGNFFYYCAPYLVFWGGNLLKGRFRAISRRVLFIGCCAVLIYQGTCHLIDIRRERVGGQSFWQYVALREYGFESFAILANVTPLYGSPAGGRALMSEFFSLVPSAFLSFEKPRTNEIMFEIMPEDAAALPNAGFYRFFCFDAYYDFGLIGATVYTFLFAFFLALAYRRMLRLTIIAQDPWPLICYMPWVMYAQFWINGVIPFAVSFSCFATTAVYLVARIERTSVKHGYALRRSPQLFQWGICLTQVAPICSMRGWQRNTRGT